MKPFGHWHSSIALSDKNSLIAEFFLQIRSSDSKNNLHIIYEKTYSFDKWTSDFIGYNCSVIYVFFYNFTKSWFATLLFLTKKFTGTKMYEAIILQISLFPFDFKVKYLDFMFWCISKIENKNFFKRKLKCS